MAGALGAIDAGTGLGHKLRVLFRERRGGKLQQNVVLDPLLEMADGEQDALWLAAVGVGLLIASGECFLLLFWLELRQEQRVAHADLVLGKGFGHCRGKLCEAGAGSNVCGRFAALGRDLLHCVIKVQERNVAVRLVQRVNIAPLQVFNDAGFECLRVGEFHDAHGNGIESGQLRRTVAPRPGYDLVAVTLGPNQQGREHALGSDGLCQFVERRFVKCAARVGWLIPVRLRIGRLRYSDCISTVVVMWNTPIQVVEREWESGRALSAPAQNCGPSWPLRTVPLLPPSSGRMARRMVEAVRWMTSRLSARSVALPAYIWM